MSEHEPDVAAAIDAAVSAIYFADSSDYFGYLWDVVKALSPEAADLLDKDESEAYKRFTEAGKAESQ